MHPVSKHTRSQMSGPFGHRLRAPLWVGVEICRASRRSFDRAAMGAALREQDLLMRLSRHDSVRCESVQRPNTEAGRFPSTPAKTGLQPCSRTDPNHQEGELFLPFDDGVARNIGEDETPDPLTAPWCRTPILSVLTR